MIFVDSNIAMYLIGADHPNKHAARRLLESAVSDGEALVTSAEVFQEILHRYGAVGRLDAIQPAFDLLLAVVDDVLSIGLDSVNDAHRVMLGSRLSARDALHVATMRAAEVHRIMSFDTDFDQVPGIERIG